MKVTSTRFDSSAPRYMGVGLLSFALIFVSVAPGLAGEYKLVKGQDAAVCEKYYKYLATQKTAITCARDIPSTFSHFKKPGWKKLNPNEHKLLVLRIENYLQIPRDAKAIEPWVPVHRELEVASYQPPVHAQLFVADFDINNDNTKEMVLKYASHGCQTWDGPKAPHWRAPLIVSDVSIQVVDIEKTYPVMQNRGKRYVSNAEKIKKAKQHFFSRKRDPLKPTTYEELSKNIPDLQFEYSKYAAGVSELQGYDVFFFKDITYFDKWDEARNGGAYQTLTVYKSESSATQEICRYQFNW